MKGKPGKVNHHHQYQHGHRITARGTIFIISKSASGFTCVYLFLRSSSTTGVDEEENAVACHRPVLDRDCVLSEPDPAVLVRKQGRKLVPFPLGQPFPTNSTMFG